GREGPGGAALRPRGSPRLPLRAFPPVPHRFRVEPARARPGDRLRLSWELPWPRARVSVQLYDLAGRHVAALLPEIDTAGRGVREASLAAAPPGVFFAVLEARAPTGGERLVETRSLRVVGVV